MAGGWCGRTVGSTGAAGVGVAAAEAREAPELRAKAAYVGRRSWGPGWGGETFCPAVASGVGRGASWSVRGVCMEPGSPPSLTAHGESASSRSQWEVVAIVARSEA